MSGEAGHDAKGANVQNPDFVAFSVILEISKFRDPI